LYEPLRNDAGAITGIFVGGYDVTERIVAEADLRRSEARLRALEELSDRLRVIDEPAELPQVAAEILGQALEVSRVGYGTIDDGADTLRVERDWTAPGVESLAGVTPLRDYGSFIDSLKRDEFIAIADVRKDERTAGAAQALERRSARSFVNVPIVEQGRLVAVLYVNHFEAREWKQDELALIKEVAARTRDTLQRRRNEVELRAREAQFRAFAQAMPNHVWAARPDGDLYWFNDQVYAYSGGEPGSHDGSAWAALVHPEDLANAVSKWQHSLATGATYETEFRIRRHDGSYRWFLVRAEPVRAADGGITNWVGTNTDIDTARRQAVELANLNATLEQQVQRRTSDLMAAEAALRQSQKMEAVGQLTGGVAHDFNNILQVIAGNLHLLGRLAGHDERVENRVASAQEAVRRGARLSSQLLAFSRRQPLAPHVLNAGRLVAGMEDMLRRALGEAIELEFVVSGGLWNTFADPTQIENAVLNLAINARDAMSGRGKLTVEVCNARLDDLYASENPEVAAGQYVMVAVSDTGSGMPAHVIARAFEPFFTTKPVGAGTGLGLAMIYGFCKQSGGHVKAYSEVGHGTTVKMYLPRSALGEQALPVVDQGPVVGGSETILVAEDDDGVRATVVEILIELGYRVLQARDADSALSVVDSGAAIDLLFTDVVMPGTMKSTELARLARARLPRLAVLFTSGYTQNAIVHGGRLDEGVELLAKPYSRDDLARKLRKLLAPTAT
jgi:PAS domain S-box-containing protein